MAENIVLAAGNAAGTSSEIAVAVGAAVPVVVWGASGENPDAQFPLERKVNTNQWQAVRTLHDGVVYLGGGVTEVLLTSPGTYRVRRPQLGGALQCGVSTFT
jgi:hypothetical protein